MRYDASFLTVFQGVIYARDSQNNVDAATLYCHDIFAALVCKSLVVQYVTSALSIREQEFCYSCSTNYYYLGSLIYFTTTRRERKYGRNNAKMYHYAVIYKRMTAFCVRFVNASVQRGALCYHTLVRYISA